MRQGSYVSQLVAVYSRRSADKVDSQQIEARLGKPFSQLQQDQAFLEENNCVRDCRLSLERVSPNLAPEDQRRACLMEVERLSQERAARTDAATIFDSLVESVLAPAWPQPERDKYRIAAEMLTQWKHYFLSYTRGGAAQLHEDFGRVLKAHHGGQMPPKEKLAKDNCVAVMANEQLEAQGLVGYFDTSDLSDGADIPDTIKRQLGQSFVLVQLIQRDIFRVPPPGRRNWPYLEFSHFHVVAAVRSKQSQLRFLIAGADLDAVTPANPDAEYRTRWLAVIDMVKYLSLKELDASFRRPSAESLAVWFKKRAAAILELRQAMLDEAMR